MILSTTAPVSTTSITESTTVKPPTPVTQVGSTTESQGTESTASVTTEIPTTTTMILSTTAPASTTSITESTTVKPPTTVTQVGSTTESQGTESTASVTTEIPTTTTMILSTTAPFSTTSITERTTTKLYCMKCEWSEWFDTHYASYTPSGGDNESIATLSESGKISCKQPVDIRCRAKDYPDKSLQDVGQKVSCNTITGLICKNSVQMGPPCLNYEIQVKCCNKLLNQECMTSTPQTTLESTTETPTTVGSTTESQGTESTVSVTTEIPTTTTMILSTTAPVSTTSITESTTVKPPTTVTQVGSTTESQGTESTASVTTEIPTTTTMISSTSAPLSTTTELTKTTIFTPTHSTGQTTFTVITGPHFTTTPPQISTEQQVHSTTTATPPTTGCTCKYLNKVFLPGSFMYNESDATGWCFTAYCDSNCNVDKTSQLCATTTTQSPTPLSSTTTPSTTHSTTTASTKTSSSTTTPPGCIYLKPPRKNGETWIEDCMLKTCNSTTVMSKPACDNPNPPVPSCLNGFPPVKVSDGNCCFHYECECKCMGWGDPHYVTFDGQYYAFQGNCTYVLVQEIIKKYNFSVHIKNYYCDIPHHLACPESLIIYYKSYKINLTQTRNPTVNKVFVNDVEKIPTISNADFIITSSGIEITVEIPGIKVKINFKGMNYIVSLPLSLFYNNTEGQCGVCDNKTNNDCRLPNGQVQSCEQTAPSWEVTGNDTCKPPPSPSPPIPCNSTNICNIIYSKVFDKCREVLPAEYIYKACQFDTCHMDEKEGCSSLEGYARMCAEQSICVDWRSSTNGLCSYSCPEHKVYMPCGPKVEKTCNTMYNDKFVTCESEFCNDNFREGCYCPNGTILFNTDKNQCTKSCSCIDFNGQPRQPGDKWNMNCQECTCSMETFSPVCKNISCPPLESCTKPGYEIQTKNCCQSCEPKPVCVVDGIEYKPGDSVPGSLCNTCHCGSKKNGTTKLHDVNCSPETCKTTCPQGSEYKAVPEKCCGECVPQACVYKGPDSTTQTIEVGQTWTSPKEKCGIYNCTKVNDMPLLVKVIPACRKFDQEDCIPGTETTTADGCCKACEQQNCRVLRNSTYLEVNGCISANPVEIATCSGACETSSIYSMAANSYMHKCSCCQERRTSNKSVEIHCPGEGPKTYSYTYIEECGCDITKCTDD